MNCSQWTQCNGTCHQGRTCEASFRATRAALGLNTPDRGAIIQDGHEIADDFLYAEKTAGTAFEMLVGLILCVVLVPLLLWLSLTV
jgi:hypothetical protein